MAIDGINTSLYNRGTYVMDTDDDTVVIHSSTSSTSYKINLATLTIVASLNIAQGGHGLALSKVNRRVFFGRNDGNYTYVDMDTFAHVANASTNGISGSVGNTYPRGIVRLADDKIIYNGTEITLTKTNTPTMVNKWGYGLGPVAGVKAGDLIYTHNAGGGVVAYDANYKMVAGANGPPNTFQSPISSFLDYSIELGVVVFSSDGYLSFIKQ